MNLISKKDLLAQTGISYGQLYRWKRQRLIPEEWFVKRSAYTGQETFFPREQALSRVRSILELKDSYSMEEMAAMFSPDGEAALSAEELSHIDEFSGGLAERFAGLCGKERPGLLDAAYGAAIVRAAREAGMGRDEAERLIGDTLPGARERHAETLCTVFCTKDGWHAVFTPDTRPPVFDDGAEARGQAAVSKLADEINAKAAEWRQKERK